MRKLFIAILIPLALQVHAHAQEKRELSMGMHLASTSGVSSSQLFDYTVSMMKAFKEHSGYSINLVKFPSDDAVQQALAENEIDIAYLPVSNTILLLDQGYKLYPFYTFAVKKKRKKALCLWQKETGAPIPVSDIEGGSYLNDIRNYSDVDLVHLRSFLFENGIDRPLWEVFKSFTIVQGTNSAFMAIAVGKADFLWTEIAFATLLKLLNPGIVEKLNYDYCTDPVYARAGYVANGKLMNEAEYKLLRTALVKFLKEFNEIAKSNQSIKILKQYLNMANAKLIPSDKDEFAKDLEVYQAAKEKGWVEEAKYIEKVMKEAPMGEPVEIKPDMEYCKNKCGNDAAECVIECLK